jgi:hypothetical protein
MEAVCSFESVVTFYRSACSCWFSLGSFPAQHLNQVFHPRLAVRAGLAYSSTLKVEAVHSSETSDNLYQTKRRQIIDDTLDGHCCELRYNRLFLTRQKVAGTIPDEVIGFFN